MTSNEKRHAYFTSLLTGTAANQAMNYIDGNTMRCLWEMADMAVYHENRTESPGETARNWIDGNYIILDAKTIQSGSTTAIVDIAIIDLQGNVLLDTLVNPGISIPPAQAIIPGVTDETLAGAPSWRELLPCVTEYIRNPWLSFYATSVSRAIEQSSVIHVDIGSPHHVGRLYAEVAGEWDAGLRKYKSHSLDSAVAFLNARPELAANEQPGRALHTCRLTREVIHAIAEVGS